jgi:hypothetical protein
METPAVGGVIASVRGFLAGLRQELPELFAPPAPLRPPRPARAVPVPEATRFRFRSRVEHWSAVMGVTPRRIAIKNQRSLWGSCSARGNLNFNRALDRAPAEVLDYVVIHELAHLKEMNHSRDFWAIVRQWCPRQKEHRRWLRQNAALLRP